MAYDEDQADRIRELLGPHHGVDEMRMFGGLAFLIGGNMAVAGEAGIRIKDKPMLLFQLLVPCMLASKTIDATMAMCSSS